MYPKILTFCFPNRAQAMAWLTALPPKSRLNFWWLKSMVYPRAGSLSNSTKRFSCMLPMTMILGSFICSSLVRSWEVEVVSTTLGLLFKWMGGDKSPLNMWLFILPYLSLYLSCYLANLFPSLRPIMITLERCLILVGKNLLFYPKPTKWLLPIRAKWVWLLFFKGDLREIDISSPNIELLF